MFNFNQLKRKSHSFSQRLRWTRTEDGDCNARWGDEPERSRVLGPLKQSFIGECDARAVPRGASVRRALIKPRYKAYGTAFLMADGSPLRGGPSRMRESSCSAVSCPCNLRYYIPNWEIRTAISIRTFVSPIPLITSGEGAPSNDAGFWGLRRGFVSHYCYHCYHPRGFGDKEM